MKNVISIVTALLLLASCEHDSVVPAQPLAKSKLLININHSVDGNLLVWDTLLYQNKAGNIYGVSRLQYYLSGFKFFNNHRLIHSVDSVFYIDAKKHPVLIFYGVPVSNYDSIAFYIGVAPIINVSYGLPATPENNAMSWPDGMGGGYHFLKLEGHWNDNALSPGFAIHLGKNGFQVSAGARCYFTISSNKEMQLNAEMNINEWFCTPHTYNFRTDGVYTMSEPTLMKKIADNGADVFTLQ